MESFPSAQDIFPAQYSQLCSGEGTVLPGEEETYWQQQTSYTEC